MARTPTPPAFRPYLAPVLLQAAPPGTGAALLVALVAEVEALVETPGGPRTILSRTPVSLSGGVRTVAIEYQHRSQPAWAPPGAWVDINHHLIVVSVKGNLAAICVSETAMRGRFGKELVAARPISRSTVETGFVGDQAKALWLNGIHVRSDAKADAKTLMGSDLELALDPLGDQSYAFKAVRSRVPLTLSGGAPALVVGAAPGEGRVWLNRPANWSAFVADVEILLDTLAAALAGPVITRFRALAQSVNDLTAVSEAYAVAFVPPDLLLEDTDPAVRDMAVRWAYGAQFEVFGGPSADMTATVTLERVVLGDLTIQPGIANGKVSLTIGWATTPPAGAAGRDAFDALVSEHDWLKLYYASGHTIAEAHCYLATPTDRWFPEFKFKALAAYDVTKEKPTVLVGSTLALSIAEPKADGQPDDSLFGYCCDSLRQGWLASDDRSMELADFIHISDAGEVTLIHAKGAGSISLNRQTSASEYEVVVGQAVKNLRHLERRTLADALEAGQHHQISRAVWRNGIREPDRTRMIARARALAPDHPRKVVIFQPQLTETEHDLCKAGRAAATRTLKMKQLNTLLLSARLSVSAVGATLEVWAAA